MGLFDTALGAVGISPEQFLGGGSGQQGSQSTSSSSSLGTSLGGSMSRSASDIWGAQAPYLQNLYSRASGLLGNQSPYTTMAQEALANRAQSGSPLNAVAQASLQDTLSGQYLPGGSKYQDISSALLNQIRPAVDTQFAGGRYGSGLHRLSLASQLQDRLAANLGQERQNMLQAAQLAPQQASQDYFDINQLYQAGQIPWQQLQNYQGLLGGPVTTSQSMSDAFNRAMNQAQSQSQSTSQGTQEQTGGLLPGLGGGSGVADLAVMGSILSDRRVKKNIKQIGWLKTLPLYKFEYKWSDIPHIGVMAQDVEKVLPSAVINNNGIKSVKYNEVLEWAL